MLTTNITATTDGKTGDADESHAVYITRLRLLSSHFKYFPDEPFKGELRAYFEPSGFTEGSWNKDAYGYIWNDKQWVREFKAALRDLGLSEKACYDVKYNPKDMQGDDYVSFEVTARFWASWKRLVKTKNLEPLG
jgi:hypothetical protein